MIRFRVLGTLDLRDAQDRELRAVLRRPKLLALLGYLAAARPAGFHRRDSLLALLWPELDTAHARNALRQAVHSLREALGRDVIMARGEEELRLSEESLWSDVRAFATALEAGQAERALELCQGGLLNGLHVSDVPDFERWVDQEREQLRQRACAAARGLTDEAEAAGNLTTAARWALRLTELSPFDETAVRRLIQLLDRAGDRAGAVQAYEEFQRRLGRDLEVRPSSETQGLVAGIRARQQPQGTARLRPTPVATGADGARAAGPTEPAADARRVARRTAQRPTRVAVLLALVAGGVLGGSFLFRAPSGGHGAETARAPKRVVVLPFSNLGPAEQQYFADGVTEEITARLAGVGALRVIGSTSANAYKGTQKSIREIGAELGVDYVLEGSVRWQKPGPGAASVRVTPQLVSTADGMHLWAQVYEAPLDEIFKVQSDIAQGVVKALDVTVLDAQHRTLATIPTRNLEAYDLYLRGRDYEGQGNSVRAARAAQLMYEKAVELDPGFALAYARLSRVHSRMYMFYYDRSPERLAMARRAVDRALELEPGLPEGHHSLASYYGFGLLDYDQALHEFATVEVSRPNDAEMFYARGVLRVRQGKFREALGDHAKAMQLDPRSVAVAGQYAQVYDLLRDFPRAEALYDRAQALAPDKPDLYYWKMWLYLRWDRNTRRARAAFDQARTADAADNLVRFTAVLVELFDRRYDEAIARLSEGTPEVLQGQARFIPRALVYAQVYGLMGRRDLERAYYDSAQRFVARRVAQRPGEARLHSALGIAYAGLGRKREAIQEGERGVELLPISKEAYQGYYRVLDLARIYTMVGDYEAAIDRLDYLLSIPGHLTTTWLRVDPTWDPLRGHPRFQRLLAGAR